MTDHRSKLVAAAVSAVMVLMLSTGAAAPASSVDRTPPTAPRIVYAQGFFCWTLYIGAQRVTDNVTPEPQIRYEAYANGRFIGLLDRGSASTAWGDLRLRDEGPNRVFVVAVDAAGNRARSASTTVTGFDCDLND
jgi:hypothetical protein